MLYMIKFLLESMSITETDNYQDIMEYVEYRLIPNVIAKKERGEVFTPLNLINKILDKLPSEVWKNPNLKWLDPANGIGNFSICVYYRLMDGLKDLFFDKKKRSKHIIENMLYMVELDSSNIAISKNIFLDGNITEQDFLKYKKPKGWPEKFDVIMGNPPFQNKDKSGDNHLYMDFAVKSIDLLIENGLLLVITPKLILDYLLRCNVNRQRFDKVYNIHYIAIDTPKIYFKNIGTNFVYFLLQNNIVKNNKCKIEYIYNGKIYYTEIELIEGMYLPNIFNSIGLNIINKTTNKIKNKENKAFMSSIIKKPYFNIKGKDRLQRIRKETFNKNIVKKTQDSKYKYKMTNGFTRKKYKYPAELCYFNHKMNDYNKSKIIISNTGFVIGYDDKGNLNLSDSLHYILGDKTYFDNLSFLIDSNLIKFILIYYKNNTQYDLFKLLTKNLYYIPLNLCTDNETIYNHYKLSQDEIKYIDRLI